MRNWILAGLVPLKVDTFRTYGSLATMTAEEAGQITALQSSVQALALTIQAHIARSEVINAQSVVERRDLVTKIEEVKTDLTGAKADLVAVKLSLADFFGKFKGGWFVVAALGAVAASIGGWFFAWRAHS
jgi:hypothetical protein